VNGNEKYLQDLYDHVETIYDGWEMEESVKETPGGEQYTRKLPVCKWVSPESRWLVVFLQQRFCLTIRQPHVSIVVY